MPRNNKPLCVSDKDLGRVRLLIDDALTTYGGDTLEYVRFLNCELRQATVLPQDRLPHDIVSLNSKIWATDMQSGKKMVVTLVTPDRTDGSGSRISILSPLGMALFGYEAGDNLDWGPIHRSIRVRVDQVRRNRHRHTTFSPDRQNRLRKGVKKS